MIYCLHRRLATRSQIIVSLKSINYFIMMLSQAVRSLLCFSLHFYYISPISSRSKTNTCLTIRLHFKTVFLDVLPNFYLRGLNLITKIRKTLQSNKDLTSRKLAEMLSHCFQSCCIKSELLQSFRVI